MKKTGQVHFFLVVEGFLMMYYLFIKGFDNRLAIIFKRKK